MALFMIQFPSWLSLDGFLLNELLNNLPKSNPNQKTADDLSQRDNLPRLIAQEVV
jgi:hypothetical protein